MKSERILCLIHNDNMNTSGFKFVKKIVILHVIKDCEQSKNLHYVQSLLFPLR